LDPNVTRGAWRAEEDVALRDLYNRLGPKWSLICRSVPGRTAQQCRARWFQIDGSTTSGRTGEGSRGERANGRVSGPGGLAFRQILAEVSARTSAPSVGRVDAHHQHAQTRTPVRASTAMDPMSLWRDASSATPTERKRARDDDGNKVESKPYVKTPHATAPPASTSDGKRRSSSDKLSVLLGVALGRSASK